ncbi:CLUMA_CG002726, isoform A [Clunio marinus]|uniref:CLUMA_CG002726, isoform A n=1 Tax=Clunio marinus TaxID=568069 RepID=A0A1J1HR47_9DIPT|nr:CLUMA_CG002726, isoform A [Clunio marinus]
MKKSNNENDINLRPLLAKAVFTLTLLNPTHREKKNHKAHCMSIFRLTLPSDQCYGLGHQTDYRLYQTKSSALHKTNLQELPNFKLSYNEQAC